MADTKDRVFEHDYDGIREYDNPLPPWWVSLFYITVIWGVLYVFYYHVFEIGDRSYDEFMREYDPMWSKENDPGYQSKSIFAAGYRAPYQDPSRDITPKQIAARGGIMAPAKEEAKEEVFHFEPLTDKASLAAGKEVYMKNCVPCHGMGGEGGIGPNLTDNYWIHGQGEINGVMKTIIKGVPEKGMLAWGKILKKDDLLPVGSYLLTLIGTNPPNGKAPQGTLVEKK